MLVQSPEPSLQISLRVILPVVLTLAGIVLFVIQRALRAHTQPVSTGPQGLVGETGIASTNLDLDGMVFVHGELWNASSPVPIRQGERVRVVGVKGLTLSVEKIA